MIMTFWKRMEFWMYVKMNNNSTLNDNDIVNVNVNEILNDNIMNVYETEW